MGRYLFASSQVHLNHDGLFSACVISNLHDTTSLHVCAQYYVLSELLSHNQTLFYHVVINNLEALAPIIYTPVVGEARSDSADSWRHITACPAAATHHILTIPSRCPQACQKFDRIYK